MRHFKVIASAYACEPQKGSEPGIGWNIVRELTHRHALWVITRANNRAVIEAALQEHPLPNLEVVYFDLPPWACWWKHGTRGLQLYYYLWQIGAYFKARALHRKHKFDLAHHVTFGRYWNPSFLSLLPIPFVWGPVGGGESAPSVFYPEFSLRGKIYETLRNTARRLGEYDPFVRLTGQRCRVALAATEETAARLRSLGARQIECLGNAALNRREILDLAAMPPPPASPVRFISIGRLLHWKGFHLALRAFAQAALQDAEYWIVGDGPERGRLESLAQRLGVADRVTFWGTLSRTDTFARLSVCHALLHPSLHDSGGWVCIEAVAAGRPVVCLDLGGPALLVNKETGFKVSVSDVPHTIMDLAEAITTIAAHPALRDAMSLRAKDQAKAWFNWEVKAAQINEAYARALREPVGHEA